MNRKLIGLICAWACEDFIEPAIKQAIYYCDEVHVCVAPHSDSLVEFADNTEKIVDTFKNYINIVRWDKRSYHATVKSEILNYMLTQSKQYKAGNVIWVLDADEFYPGSTFNSIRGIIQTDTWDQICVEEYYFYINMQHYLLGDHNRLFKIKPVNLSEDCRFRPTQNWYGVESVITLPLIQGGMFHYGMLTNPWAKFAFWKSEYQGLEQLIKTKWLDHIYRKYDLNNEDFWTDVNQLEFGIKSPWFADSFKPNKNGRLFKYDGQHPWAVNNNYLTLIDDFRVSYKF